MEGLLEGTAVVFFDLDDTLIAYNVEKEDCWRTACSQQVLPPGTPPVDELVMVLEEQSAWFWSDPERDRTGRLDMLGSRRKIVRQALQSLGIDDEHLAHAIADTYHSERDRRMYRYPGVPEALRRLRDMGIRTGLITNGSSEAQRAKLARFELAEHFEEDLVFIEGEMGYGKPDIRVFLRAMAAVGVDGERLWMVGDSYRKDIVPPSELGWRTALISRHRAGRSKPPATLVVGSVADLAIVWWGGTT